ncbi:MULTISPECIES: gluconate 2-dehydrogenase subunit 3 family protein [unclassified Mesorhizobium]|nr:MULTISPECIES: gluconate 2-dehydrogenase subunit 3 family protein [unclassified Mesorhizobium]AZO28412.1 gluconate 2-dehydrogenase subunit 3 family protein [Mesorhizobium sp. M1B.F.Ca.ET.045.04.1.1]RWE03124.1 MAG: twin-arginine translocation signal domain-containing protein [Mesorhizobium sp.]TIS45559.1 MAG: twin-arginine translocation signal domain-containing protein [Mesorhizobium sp.]
MLRSAGLVRARALSNLTHRFACSVTGEIMSTKEKSDRGDVGRRDFLKLFGAAGAAAGTLPFSGSASADETMAAASDTKHHHVTAATDPHAGGPGYEFFNVNESAFIEAAVDTLIPSDATGPGAKELGVATYIDRQMAGGYGKGDRLYLEGPFGEGTPEQGYQLPMTPSELIRAGIADVSAYVQKERKSTFDGLSAKDRAAVMADLDSKKVELPTVPTATFFGLLLQLTIEGYFADPMYGGNKGAAAWKMIGFPGADAMYADKIEPFRNKPYKAEPKGIQDLI